MTEIQIIELDILRTIQDTLSKHNIKPFLIGGTLIGAIRHNGFIPWDDDIDIGLLRKDYEAARIILMKELPEGYLYCDWKTDVEFPYNFGKVRKRNTAFVHGGDAHLKYHHGIYVDIFPIDTCADDIEKARQEIEHVKKLRSMVDLYYMNPKKYGMNRPVWQRVAHKFGKAFINVSKVQSKIDSFCKCHENLDSSLTCLYLGIYGKKDIYERAWFDDVITKTFEEVDCYVPIGFNEYLTRVYGDYMQLPPVEKRVSHHDVIYESTTQEYNPTMLENVLKLYHGNK